MLDIDKLYCLNVYVWNSFDDFWKLDINAYIIAQIKCAQILWWWWPIGHQYGWLMLIFANEAVDTLITSRMTEYLPTSNSCNNICSSTRTASPNSIQFKHRPSSTYNKVNFKSKYTKLFDFVGKCTSNAIKHHLYL